MPIIDFSKPISTDNFRTGVLPGVNTAITALAQMLDPNYVTYASPVAGIKRLNNGNFEQFNGSSWVGYTVSIAGDAGRARGLTRSDSAVDDYNVQSRWDGNYWNLQGYLNSTFHAGVRVAYADAAGNASKVGGLGINNGNNTLANGVVRTDGSGYANFGWINTISGDAGTGAITRVYASTDGYLRYYTLPNFTAQVQAAASGSWGINAFPRRSDGAGISFNWSGQGGQPPWLWGGSDGTNMYVYNPANFSVNYATSAGSAGSVPWSGVTGKPISNVTTSTAAPSGYVGDGVLYLVY